MWLAAMLLAVLPLLIVLATAYSGTGQQGPLAAVRATLAELGLGEPHSDQAILGLRLYRVLVAAGVGGTLALAGAMTQGLFRNPLAEPGLLGIGSGASLGAICGMALLGGYAPDEWVRMAGGSRFSLALVPVCAFVGALAAAVAIYRLAARGGRISVPALLLTGLAVNAILGALMAALQVLLLEDWQVSRAIIAWGFGTLDDRTGVHLAIIGAGALLALLTIPFVGLELDLLAGGEDDAATLGGDPRLIKTLVLGAVALSTAAAVAVAGQIAFIGLLVPHAVRLVAGPRHRALLPLSFLAGAVLLAGVVVVQRALCPLAAEALAQSGSATASRTLTRLGALQPGVLTSLFGAPFFLLLLLRQARKVQSW
jgi:iron complex transport system permease protein